jgi:GldM N-terminal domain
MTATCRTLSRYALLGLLGGLGACQSAPTETELLRLHLLTDELTVLNGKVAATNEELVKSIRDAVAKNRNQPRDIAVLEQSVAVRAETQRLVAYLRGLRQQLSPTKAQTLEQLADRRAVAAVLLDGGRADSLQQRLHRYATHIGQSFGPEAQPRLATAGTDPRVRGLAGERVRGQSFQEFFFRTLPWPQRWQCWPSRKPRCCGWKMRYSQS